MASAKRRTPQTKRKPTAIGEFLRDRREQLGMSIDDVSYKSRVPSRQIGAYERGENVPGEENLTAILVALDVKVPWLAYSAKRTNPGQIDLPVLPTVDEPIALALP